MREPLGDPLFWIALSVSIFTFVASWIILLLVTFFEYLFPRSSDILERFIHKFGKYFDAIQKYSLITAISLLVLRIVVGWLGWAPEFP